MIPYPGLRLIFCFSKMFLCSLYVRQHVFVFCQCFSRKFYLVSHFRLPNHSLSNGYGSLDLADTSTNIYSNNTNMSANISFPSAYSDSIMKKCKLANTKQQHQQERNHQAEDDIHVGIQCLRAIMNNSVLFFIMFQIYYKSKFFKLNVVWIQHGFQR